MSIGNLKSCPICNRPSMFSAYVGNREWKYTCQNCGQYFKLNAVSHVAADIIYNTVIGGDIRCQERTDQENRIEAIIEN